MSLATTMLSGQSWAGYFGNILRALAGSKGGTADVLAVTAPQAASASVGLGITSDVGEGFKAVSAIAGLVQQRDKELNTPALQQAATAQKVQDLQDHANAAIEHAEATGDFTALRLLLS